MSVELTVRSRLEEIIKDFDSLNKRVREVNETLSTTSDEVENHHRKNVKNTQNYLGKLKDLSSNVSRTIKDDFKSLLSISALQDAGKLTNQFKSTISEAVVLNDSIRKMGTSLGISNSKFNEFHRNMIQGLGDLGLASEVGAKTMEGLVDTPVRGQKSLIEYSRTAGQLASISGQKGKEGDIARGIANVIKAKGGDVNNLDQVSSVAEDLRKAYSATGKGPTEMLGTMEKLFAKMPKELRESMSTSGLVNLSASAQVAGPASTQFLEQYLGMSKIQRSAFDAQGFEGVIGKEGIDIDKFNKAAQDVLSRVGGDPRMAAKTLGLTDEAADGFVRLAENIEEVKKAQDAISKSTGSLTKQYRDSLGLGEAFKANINKVKGTLAEPLSEITGGLTDILGNASETTAGSGAVVAGGGILAALLAGGGLRGVGKGLGLGGMAQKNIYETVTGEEVQDVYVVNASDIGGGSVVSNVGKKAGMLGMLGKAGLVAGAGALGYMGGKLINEKVIQKTESTTSEGFKGNVIEQLFFKIDKLIGGEGAKNIMKAKEAYRPKKVIIENRATGFKATEVSRGVRN